MQNKEVTEKGGRDINSGTQSWSGEQSEFKVEMDLTYPLPVG